MAEWESTFFKTEIRTQMESLNQHHLGRHRVHDAAALPSQIAIDNKKAGGIRLNSSATSMIIAAV